MNWSSEHLITRPRAARLGRRPRRHAVTPADLGTVSRASARGIVVEPRARRVARAKRATPAGFEEGYAAGYTRRHRRRPAGTSSCSASLVQRLGREADALATPGRQRPAPTSRDQVVATALQIAEVLVGHELAQPDGRGRDAIARAPSRSRPMHGDVTARLHPADIAVFGDPAALAPGPRRSRLVPDPSLCSRRLRRRRRRVPRRRAHRAPRSSAAVRSSS